MKFKELNLTTNLDLIVREFGVTDKTDIVYIPSCSAFVYMDNGIEMCCDIRMLICRSNSNQKIIKCAYVSKRDVLYVVK